MRLRAGVALFVAVVSLPRVASAAERWHSVVTAPLPNLPAVEITLGYPGSYVPAVNAPAEFRARTTGRAFDGYIGYHIGSTDRRSLDVPVVSRAVLGANAQWTFSTQLQLYLGMAAWDPSFFRKRELVIEWRDRDMKVIAERSVGAPPWVHPPRRLRVLRNAADAADERAFAEPTVHLDAASLSDVPQWYAGFSAVIVATDLWFELPQRVRDAIFRSALDVVFVGIPQRMPSMSAQDRALLPVELRATPGVVDVPWPYHGGQPRTIAAPVSWTAKSGADIVGAQANPYLVSNGISAFVAEERGLQDPMPPFTAFAPRGSSNAPHRTLPTIGEVLRDYRPALLFTLFAIFSIAAWLVFRRRSHVAVPAICAALALLAIGWRDAIRPAAEVHAFERVTMSAPGIVDTITTHDSAGMGPMTAPASETEAARMNRVIGGGVQRVGDDVEVRTSQTPPGYGELHRPGRPWIVTWRTTKRRELGEPATVRVRSRDAKQLVVEYESATPVGSITAEWFADGNSYYGETHVSSQRGVATIPSAQRVWSELNFWPWLHDSWRDDETRRQFSVHLMQIENGRAKLIRHVEPRPPAPARYTLFSALRPHRGAHAALFFLPGAPVNGAAVVFRIAGGPAAQWKDATIRVAGPGGTVNVQPSTVAPFGAELSASDAMRIAPQGGLIQVSVQTPSEVLRTNVELRVGRKSK